MLTSVTLFYYIQNIFYFLLSWTSGSQKKSQIFIISVIHNNYVSIIKLIKSLWKKTYRCSFKNCIITTYYYFLETVLLLFAIWNKDHLDELLSSFYYSLLCLYLIDIMSRFPVLKLSFCKLNASGEDLKLLIIL